MERRVIIVCCFVGFLGILSAATGFAADAKRIKASQVIGTPSGCRSPRTPAFGLGLTAAVSLLIAQIILIVCICNSPHQFTFTSNWFFYCSWITFVLAFVELLGAAALNDEHIRENLNLGDHFCFFVDPGSFFGGAFLSLASVTLGIFCYLTLTLGNDSNKTPYGASAFRPTQDAIVMGYPQGGIAMGYPEVHHEPS